MAHVPSWRFKPVIAALRNMGDTPSKRQMRFPSTLVVGPFVYLRLPRVGDQEVWSSPKASEPAQGNMRLPFDAVRFRCAREKGLVEINKSHSGERTGVLTFSQGSEVVIIGSSLLYFENQLIGSRSW